MRRAVSRSMEEVPESLPGDPPSSLTATATVGRSAAGAVPPSCTERVHSQSKGRQQDGGRVRDVGPLELELAGARGCAASGPRICSRAIHPFASMVESQDVTPRAARPASNCETTRRWKPSSLQGGSPEGVREARAQAMTPSRRRATELTRGIPAGRKSAMGHR